MSDVYQALNDVRWLSDRLKGLMTLGQEIESYDALKDQTAEMSSTIANMKNEVLELQAKLDALGVAREKAEENISLMVAAAKADGDAIVARALANGEIAKLNAEADAQRLREAATADVTATNIKITEAKSKLKDLTDKIAAATDTYNKLQSDINSIKARF